MFKNSETLRLDQIAEVTMGQSPDSSSYNSVGKGIPFYQGKTEFTDKYIGQPSTWCTSPTRIAKENDILMSVRAPVGNVNIATEECCIGRGLSSIRPQNGFNSEFIFEALEQKKEELENKATGSTFKAINKDIVLSIQIPNTSISIQKEYSNFVKQIDKSKFLLQQILEKFELLKKSRFIEMFENKTYKKVEGRNLFKFSSGKFLPIAKRMTSGIPVYGGNGISWYTDETLVSFDTIVIGRVGAYCGNVMLVKGDKWITDNAIYISEFKTKDLKLEFLEKLMESYDFHSFSDSSAQPKITQRPLENQLYIVPPIELQEEYINQIKQIDKSKFNVFQDQTATQVKVIVVLHHIC